MINCLICGKFFKAIVIQHLKIHNITTEEYKRRFPGELVGAMAGKNGVYIAWNVGLTKETDERIAKGGVSGSKTIKEQFKNGRKSWNYGLTKEDPRVAKYINRHIGSHHSEKTNQLISEALTGKGWTEERRQKAVGRICLEAAKNNISKGIIEFYKDNPKARDLMVARTKSRWEALSEEEKVNRIKKIGSRASQRPNGLEIKIINILSSLNLDKYDFTGNNSFFIGHRNPDFVNKKDRKIIESFGNHWHRNDDPEEWINYYSSFGYQCIVIWENEVYKNKDLVISKILELENKSIPNLVVN